LTIRESENRGIRRPQRLDRIAEIVGVDKKQLRPIIDAYRQAGVTFLMPPVDVSLEEDTVIDISHESLMRVWKRLRDWVETEAQSVGIFNRIAESAMLHERGEAGLYHDPELGIALGWRELAQPKPAWAAQYGGSLESATFYLDASKQAADQEERDREATRQRELVQARTLAENERLRAEERARAATRLKGLLSIAAVVALIALIASVVAWDATQKARINEVIAEENAEKAEVSAGEALMAKEMLRDEIYAADMRRVSMLYESDTLTGIPDLLRKQIPMPEERDLRGLEWYYWVSAFNQGLRPSLAMLSAASIAPNHQWIASVDIIFDTVRILDSKSFRVIRELELLDDVKSGVREGEMDVAISPDGSELAVSGPDHTIRRWNTATWERLDTNLDFQSSSTVKLEKVSNGTALLPRENMTYTMDGAHLVIFDSETREEVQRLSTMSSISSIKAYGDGRLIALGTRTGMIQILSTEVLSDPARLMIPGNGVGVSRMAFSPSGKRLSVEYDGEGPYAVFDEVGDVIARPNFTSVGRSMFFVENDTKVSIDGTAVDLDEIQNPEAIENTGKGVDWSYLAGGQLAWRENTGDELLGRETGYPYYGKTGMRYETNPEPVRLYHVSKGSHSLWHGGKPYAANASSLNGRYLVALGGDRQIEVWDVIAGRLVGEMTMPSDPSLNGCFGLAVSNDGRYVAWSRQKVDSPVTLVPHIWETSLGKIRKLDGENRAYFFAFRPGDSLLLGVHHSPSGTWGIGAWDLGFELRPRFSTRHLATVICVAHDGSIMATANFWDHVRLLDLESGLSSNWNYEGPFIARLSLAFSHDDQRLFSSEDDGGIRLTDVKTGETRMLLPNEGGPVLSLVVDPEGLWMASKSSEEDLRIWHFGSETTFQNDLQFRYALLEQCFEKGAYKEGLQVVQEISKESAALDFDDFWFQEAVLYLATDNLKSFRQFRKELIERFNGKVGKRQSVKLALLCLCVPGDPSVLAAGLRFNGILSRGAAADDYVEFRDNIHALRNGRYQESLEGDGETDTRERGLIRALSHYHLGNHEEAQRSLLGVRAAITPLAAAYPNMYLGFTPNGRYRGILFTAMLREAELLIEGKVRSVF
jgi:WD40 repeat protein